MTGPTHFGDSIDDDKTHGEQEIDTTVSPAAEKRAIAEPSVSYSSRRFWLLLALAWTVTLVLGLTALSKIFFHDGTLVLTGINAFTRYIYLPAYATLAWAIWKQQRLLALVSLAIVACHVAWMSPNVIRDRRFDNAYASASTQSASPPTLRIFCANVLAGNEEYASMIDEIKRAVPDIIVLIEITPYWQRELAATPVMAPYVYGTGKQHTLNGGVNVYSKLPLKSDTQQWFAQRLVETIELPVGSQTLRIIALHSPRPANPSEYDYIGFWHDVVPLLKSVEGPLVIVGDFNATEHSLVYKQLTADRLRSAHDDRGRGFASTWPNGNLPFLPIRIDQAFLSPEVECIGISEGIGKGSDHKPLVLDVQLRPSALHSPARSEGVGR